MIWHLLWRYWKAAVYDLHRSLRDCKSERLWCANAIQDRRDRHREEPIKEAWCKNTTRWQAPEDMLRLVVDSKTESGPWHLKWWEPVEIFEYLHISWALEVRDHFYFSECRMDAHRIQIRKHQAQRIQFMQNNSAYRVNLGRPDINFYTTVVVALYHYRIWIFFG